GIEREDRVTRARSCGEHLRAGIKALDQPLIADVRGVGQLNAIVLTKAMSGHGVQRGLDRGLIVNAVAPDAVRLAPPLILTETEAETFISALPDILDAASATAGKEAQ